jgi:hypothetical protein
MTFQNPGSRVRPVRPEQGAVEVMVVQRMANGALMIIPVHDEKEKSSRESWQWQGTAVGLMIIISRDGKFSPFFNHRYWMISFFLAILFPHFAFWAFNHCLFTYFLSYFLCVS